MIQLGLSIRSTTKGIVSESPSIEPVLKSRCWQPLEAKVYLDVQDRVFVRMGMAMFDTINKKGIPYEVS